MSEEQNKPFVFYVDVDNTLLDNDKIKREIRKSLTKVLGKSEAHHFWLHHESFRTDKKYVDFPAIVREYCKEQHPDSCDLKVNAIFNAIDFRKAILPKVPEVMEYLRLVGKVIIFTEGDLVYQKRKVEQSGLKVMADAFPLGHRKLDVVERAKQKFPGKTLVFIDDKHEVLRSIKRALPGAFTIHVKQGHYGEIKSDFEADVSLERIGEMLRFDFMQLNR